MANGATICRNFMKFITTMEYKDITSPQNLVHTADMPGGHTAYLTSLEGQHTPGRNSDAVYLNQNLEAQDEQPSKLLALVNDGVTGETEYIPAGFGQFAAKYLADTLPTYWNQELQKGAMGFSETERMPRCEGVNANQQMINWLIANFKNSTPLPTSVCKWVIRQYADLFFTLQPNQSFAKLKGLTAAELSRIAVIDAQRFQEILRILVACSMTVANGHDAAKALISKNILKGATKEPYAVTTCCGAIETAKDYVLFSIGDSEAMAVDEIGLIEGSSTNTFSNGSTPLTACLGWNRSSPYMPPACQLVGDKFIRSSGVSIKFLPKAELHDNLAIVLMSDGFKFRYRAEAAIAETLSQQIYDCRRALTNVITEAFRFEEKMRMFNDKLCPDDKTMVVIRKDFSNG